ncbi:hypothetical protein [uncultured Tateyamaria sp.]|uniref:hypothetical protein n=1 Tax=Tateyamaria sp. 1078 TaxID=3417464 RepID=UPI002627D9E4|nr:hypothetical protein [uncultured Tateyamaria sp.]
MSDQPLYIHAGAHRTGTSSFQMCLHENRALVQARGYALAYPPRDDIPSGTLALRLPRPRDSKLGRVTIRTTRLLSTHSGGLPLILSEENVPGRMMHFIKGQFYPAAEKRCAVLREAWPGPIAHVMLVVRPYDQLFVSGFRKRAEDNPVPPFDVLRPNYMRMDRGWPELVGILRDVLRPERLTVVPYAARGTSASLLARLVPVLASETLKEPVRNMNVSATEAALVALQARYAKDEAITRTEWQSVVAAHADDREPRGFASFAAEEVTHWADTYARDLDRIAAMDGITLERAP